MKLAVILPVSASLGRFRLLVQNEAKSENHQHTILRFAGHDG
jgi:hypothetical protein